ncbi:MAG: hypothetical protein WA633_04810 [Stellaceae bacterium]
MHNLLMVGCSAGLVAAAAAVWLPSRRPVDSRIFAGLITTAVTLTVFSVIAWAATAIARIAPLPLIWTLIGMLALLFAMRLYRELQVRHSSGPR